MPFQCTRIVDIAMFSCGQRPTSPPGFLNLFMKKFTRERVAPIISASVSCEMFRRPMTSDASWRK